MSTTNDTPTMSDKEDLDCDALSVAKIVRHLNQKKTIESRITKLGDKLTLEESQQCLDEIKNIFQQVLQVSVSPELDDYKQTTLLKIQLSVEKARNQLTHCQLIQLKERMEEQLWTGKEREWQINQELESRLDRKRSITGLELSSLSMSEVDIKLSMTIGGCSHQNDGNRNGTDGGGNEGQLPSSHPMDTTDGKATGESKQGIKRMVVDLVSNDTIHNRFTSLAPSPAIASPPSKRLCLQTDEQHLDKATRLEFELQENFVRQMTAEEFQRNFFLAIKQPASNGFLLFKTKTQLDSFVKEKMIKKMDDCVSFVTFCSISILMIFFRLVCRQVPLLL